jgi:hypothetical protein
VVQIKAIEKNDLGFGGSRMWSFQQARSNRLVRKACNPRSKLHSQSPRCVPQVAGFQRAPVQIKELQGKKNKGTENQFKACWQSSLLHECFTITSKEHAV